VTEPWEDAAEELMEQYEIHEIIDKLIYHGICDSDDILECLQDFILELQEIEHES
jgi:hypothetical protein